MKKEITVCTWNIGYGGLGETASFRAEGGSQTFSTRRHTRTNQKEIENLLQDIKQLYGVDVFVIQEYARGSILNGLVNIKRSIKRLTVSWGWHTYFAPVISLMGIVQHGQVTCSHHPYVKQWSILLRPKESIGLFAISKKCTFVELANNIVIGNVHTTAYQRDSNDTEKQVKQVIGEVDNLVRQGKTVIVGGDWNMLFPGTNISYGSRPGYYNPKMINHIPPTTVGTWYNGNEHTMRSLEGPYSPTQSSRLTVDGFFMGHKNIHSVKTKTLTYGFKNSDHNPVITRVVYSH